MEVELLRFFKSHGYNDNESIKLLENLTIHLDHAYEFEYVEFMIENLHKHGITMTMNLTDNTKRIYRLSDGKQEFILTNKLDIKISY